MMAPGLDIKDTLRPSITVLSPALGAAFLLRMELSPCPSHLHPWPLSPPRDAVGSACTTLPEQLFLLVSVKADTSHFGRPWPGLSGERVSSGPLRIPARQRITASLRKSCSQRHMERSARDRARHVCVQSALTEGSVQWTPGRVSSGQMRRIGRKCQMHECSLHHSPNSSVCLKTFIIKHREKSLSFKLQLQPLLTEFAKCSSL